MIQFEVYDDHLNLLAASTSDANVFGINNKCKWTIMLEALPVSDSEGESRGYDTAPE